MHLTKSISLLHVRGGVSNRLLSEGTQTASSPRPWRCFFIRMHAGENMSVFSTSVEVFLDLQSARVLLRSLLHVRGGVSAAVAKKAYPFVSSPRPWRCFVKPPPTVEGLSVFSTSVEVFPMPRVCMEAFLGLLHVRGGVSSGTTGLAPALQSSPRPWRCFQRPRHSKKPARVFSTSVEVFPGSPLFTTL